MAEDIYLNGNDYEVEKAITRRATSTGDEEAAGGLSLTARVAATDGGGAIHASLEVAMTERASAAGTYYAILQGADLDTHLTAYAGQRVWLVVGDEANVQVSDAVRVQSVRRSS